MFSLLATSGLEGTARGQAFFQGLRTADEPSFHISALSADGHVAVGIANSFPCRWTRTGGVELLELLPGATFGWAMGVSGDGSFVVGYGNPADAGPDGYEAFRWSSQTGMIGLGVIPDGPPQSIANAVSDDGTVIVGEFYYVAGQVFLGPAMVWTTARGIDYLSKYQASALGLTSDGAKAVGYEGDEVTCDYRATVWTIGGSATHLAPLGEGCDGSECGVFGDAIACAISEDQSTIVGDSTPADACKHQPARWEPDVSALHMLPGDLRGSARDVNADGTVIVGFTQGSDTQAVKWAPGAEVQLIREELINSGAANVTGWKLEAAIGVSADGNIIAGMGISPDGLKQPWIAYLNLPCYSDIDENGILDLFDFLAFENLFNDGSGYADCDRNGWLDLFDFLCFVNSFNGGC